MLNAEKKIMPRLEPVREMLSGVKGLPDMFTRCFLNTIQTTVKPQDDGNTFVITGDIPAMWLRDSTAQVMHYIRFADDSDVADLIEGLIREQMRLINIDPYANAFNGEPNANHWSADRPEPSPWVWEKKYEIDSLCYPLLLAQRFTDRTGRTGWMDETFVKALETILTVFETEQNHADSEYYFVRENCPASDTLTHDGHGEPVAVTGMTWSGFRPSDDACVYGYLIPSNLFVTVVMRYAAGFARTLNRADLAARAEKLAAAVQSGLDKYAHVNTERFGDIYAYETDGLGNYTMMDDANVPSLMSLPYLGVCDKDDALYRRTRAWVLSSENPFYYTGKFAQGVGSPHTPAGYIWPIALCMQAMTSTDDTETAACLKAILATDAGTGFMHESFDPDAPEKFTRTWFAWANSLFGEFIYELYEQGRLTKILAMI